MVSDCEKKCVIKATIAAYPESLQLLTVSRAILWRHALHSCLHCERSVGFVKRDGTWTISKAECNTALVET